MAKSFNKSEILKRAWKLFNNQSVKTDEMFSLCLKNSWTIAKQVPTIEVLYKQYYRPIYNFIAQRVQNTDICQELTNDTFIKANQNLHKFNCEVANVSTWLHTIAKNLIIDQYRTSKADNYINVGEFADENGKEVFQFSDSCKTDSMVENMELSGRIMTAINNLKPNYKRIAELYLLNDLPYNEISELCEVPIGTVKGMINRVKAMLQSELKHEYEQI